MGPMSFGIRRKQASQSAELARQADENEGIVQYSRTLPKFTGLLYHGIINKEWRPYGIILLKMDRYLGRGGNKLPYTGFMSISLRWGLFLDGLVNF